VTTIVWFRRDLRLTDNPALSAAAARGPVIPVYIHDEEGSGEMRAIGGASRWWLHHSLTELDKSLGGLGLFREPALDVLQKLVTTTGADAVYWNRLYEPDAIARDMEIKSALTKAGIEANSFPGNLLHEPWETVKNDGTPFKVFTPFWRAARAKPGAPPLPAPAVILAPFPLFSEALEDWNLTPHAPNWAAGWSEFWQPGGAGAAEALDTFLDEKLSGYGELRDRPDLDQTSRLSPHLHFGEISPRQIFARATHLMDRQPVRGGDGEKFLSEVGWREYSHHLLYHYPNLPTANWKPAFDAYPWRDSADDLRAWQQGQTGYPMVDAGLRELWTTGTMHNRVRMIAASFLIKHLRIDWREGEAWFWDTLLDADTANNAAGWQWVAGSGADGSPYFRIFNPITQGRKFDPEGDYVRKWCPELAGLPNKLIHAPFEATEIELAAAGIKLGETYPHPIVDHKIARENALAGYEKVKQAQTAQER